MEWQLRRKKSMNKYLVKTDSTLMEFLLNHYNKKNVKNLLKFKQVSVNGQVISQFDYSLKRDEMCIRDSGEGVDVDHHQAFKLYQKAAEANYAPGLYHLALAYEEGNGVDVDIDKAIEYYELASHQAVSYTHLSSDDRITNIISCFRDNLYCKDILSFKTGAVSYTHLPLLLKLALPAILAQIINVLYNMVDRMYIGHIPILTKAANAEIAIITGIVTPTPVNALGPTLGICPIYLSLIHISLH